MMKLMSQAENLDDGDPRQMGHFMERMMEIAGQDKNPEVQEAIRRLKAGEDRKKSNRKWGRAGLGAGGPGADPGGGYGYDSNLYDM